MNWEKKNQRKWLAKLELQIDHLSGHATEDLVFV